MDRRRFLTLSAAAVAVPLLGGTRASAHISRFATDPLDAYIQGRMKAARVPGLAATIVRDGAVVWARGYGWADAAAGHLADPDAVFMLASISKTVMATAAMQAVETGILDLDADVNDVLPFPVRNPSFPDVPITLRMLLTHTASIRDNWAVISPAYVPGDSTVALGDYLKRYLSPPSDIYSPSKNYAKWGPGAAHEYCNIGASLAGFLVEAASGTPFDRWCEDRIFGPLGMTDTGWHLADVDPSTVAMPYRFKKGRYVPYGQYGYPDYPDGELRTSARHLSSHLLSFIGFGVYGGQRVLQHATVTEMRREQFPSVAPGQGLIWYRWTLEGMDLMGHNGGDSGVATQMFFRPGDGVGVIVLTNGDWHKSKRAWPLYDILSHLFAAADTL